ncbi:MAG: PhzF family phenazine biosynthesis protein [Colwellia sp.]|nr:PhzF family phenazine biosynthesis protein [Colwellia sp.]
MKIKVQFINAFSDELFKGNSAAVIITDDWLSDSVMQLIATENNLSETAFLKPLTAEKFEIRWFSPITEIDFCGHATLAASFAIFAKNHLLKKLTFITKSVGYLTVIEESNGYIQMSLPNLQPKKLVDIPDALIKGLTIAPSEVLLSEQAYFVIYNSATDVVNVNYDSQLLKQLAPFDVVVTAKSEQYDFVSRYFWPANGGDEDPVTGSVHAGLAPYWSEKLNKTTLSAYQASVRGGELRCKVDNDRVYVSGKAIQYLEGEITV